MKRNLTRRIWEKFSIYLKLPVLFFTTLLVATLYFSWYGYHTALDLLIQSIDIRLKLCVEAVDVLMENDYPDRAARPGGVTPEEYAEFCARLERISEEGGLFELYILIPRYGRFYEIAGTNSYFNEPYEDDWESLLAIRADGISRYDEGYDSFGHSRSLIAHYTSPKGMDYYVGADILLKEIDALKRTRLKQFIVAGILSFFMVGLISLSIVRLITRPLKRLSDFTEANRRDGFSGNVQIDSDLLPLSRAPADEVRLLARNIRYMQSELAEHIVRLTETVAAKERVESEMAIAGEIQQDLLGAVRLRSDAFDVWGAMHPAKSVGGDFYDFFMLDERRLCFAIGDVSGKGVSAAVFMSAALTLFRALARNDRDEKDMDALIARVMSRVDEALSAHNEALMFVTSIMGAMDTETGDVSLVNGGHAPPYLVAPAPRGGFVPLPPAMPLGGGMAVEFVPVHLRLEPGEGLFLYTDGVTEALAKDGTFFGDQRLVKTIGDNLDLEPAGLAEAVMRAVYDFSAGRDLADDVTCVCLRRSGGSESNARMFE